MNKWIVLKAWTERVVSLGLALFLMIAVSAESIAALPANPQDNVRSFYDALLTTMNVCSRNWDETAGQARPSPEE